MNCSVVECASAAICRGWCDKHYRRWKLHGDPLFRKNAPVGVECVMTDCAGVPIAHQLCRTHYYKAKRLRAAGAHPDALLYSRPIGPRPRANCSVEGCANPLTSRGWCGEHYQRWRRFGDPVYTPTRNALPCKVEACERDVVSLGLCSPHYYRLRTYGDPEAGQAVGRITPMEEQPARPCLVCGRSFLPGRSRTRLYCSKKCKPSGRIAGSVNKRVWVIRLGDEDGWKCWLCHKPVDRNLTWPHVRAGSVDHVLEVARGGTDERKNLRLAHLTCNVRRGASVRKKDQGHPL